MDDIGNPIAKMISTASAVAALEPGHVLSLRVNHKGLGPVQDGDRVRIEIAPIGSFEVGVRDKLGRRWESKIDTGAANAVKRMLRGERVTIDVTASGSAIDTPIVRIGPPCRDFSACFGSLM